MKTYTVAGAKAKLGVHVTAYDLNGKDIPVVTVGETGRGSKLGVMPVRLTPESREAWAENGRAIVYAGNLSLQPIGLHESDDNSDSDFALVVLRTPIGFRGGNDHTGVPDGDDFAPFPGRWLVHGMISQGAAGRMGSGAQGIAVVPVGVTFCTHYSGRLYGAPPEHYHCVTADGVITRTQDEVDVFGYV